MEPPVERTMNTPSSRGYHISLKGLGKKKPAGGKATQLREEMVKGANSREYSRHGHQKRLGKRKVFLFRAFRRKLTGNTAVRAKSIHYDCIKILSRRKVWLDASSWKTYHKREGLERRGLGHAGGLTQNKEEEREGIKGRGPMLHPMKAALKFLCGDSRKLLSAKRRTNHGVRDIKRLELKPRWREVVRTL